jgi:hypothetical protein
MLYGYLKKVCILLIFLATTIFFFQGSLSAQTTILSRTGTIKITLPDSTVLVIGKDDALPDIPSGSKVEIISGSLDIGPSAGFIQLVVGDSVATVKAGDRVTASIDPATKMEGFKVSAGQIKIITGNTSTTVQTNQEVRISLDKRTGRTEVRSVKGDIETTTIGVKVMVRQGADALIDIDPKTRTVHVKSIDGDVTVASLDGKVIRLAKAESTQAEGSVEGEIQTFGEEAMPAFVPAEEPAEPERPEASPHRP